MTEAACTNSRYGPQIALFGIGQQPQNEVVCNVGTATASFKIKVLGSDITYQWQKNGTNILWATSSTYSFTPTTADHDAKFRCIVKSSSCTTSITSEAVSYTHLDVYKRQGQYLRSYYGHLQLHTDSERQ